MIKLEKSFFSRFRCSEMLFFSLLLLVGTSSCHQANLMGEPVIPLIQTPWEAYSSALDSNGLGASQLAKNWREAGLIALEDSVLIDPPFQETGYFRAESPAAHSFKLELKTGELLKIDLSSEPDSSLFFVDLFHLQATDSTKVWQHKYNAEPFQTDSLGYEIQESGIYVLRIQPELLVSCRYNLSLIIQPVYGAFPVSGKGNRDVWSFFGDPRDGGKRDHKGIDIFARRGTPVVAAVNGLIRSVRDKGLGGKQVWLYDSWRRQSLYYAHLDSQLVKEGTIVQVGDTLGLVGNTGNARNTRPHLHFAIYRRGWGAIDPHPFVAIQTDEAPRISADTSRLGQWVRVRQGKSRLKAAPHPKSTTLSLLDRHLPLRVIAASKKWYRVLTPDGFSGYLPDGNLEDVDRPIQEITLSQSTELFQSPHAEAIPIFAIPPEAEVAIIGRNGTHQLVRENHGLMGWMPISAK